ncbi:MAG: alpha/beta hydrolase-fold protein [Phycisphaerales bacterium]|nr:alpha/beta hydrolase-fold protein [Phycisphaerales bacterium]
MRLNCRACFVVCFITLCILISATHSADANEHVVDSNPYVVIPMTDERLSFIRTNLKGLTERVWLDGDVLWLAKNNRKGPWKTTGGISEQLTQVGDSDFWATGLKWDRWTEAFIKVAFYKGDFPTGPMEYINWRGKHAPPSPKQADPSNVVTYELIGPDKDKKRNVTVVLPPQYDDKNELPALVLADGQSAEEWGKIIAAMINDKKIRPVVVIGVHNGGYQGDRSQPYDAQFDIRAREYLEGFDQDRFSAHLDWLIDTVLTDVARRYNISLERENLAVAGFSNGGAFASSAALRRGDVFGLALALSVGIPPDIEPQTPNALLSQFFCAAGELESRFLQQTNTLHNRLSDAGGEPLMQSYVAGHDAELWTTAMSEYLPLMFPPE